MACPEDLEFNCWNDAPRAKFYTTFRPPYQNVVIPWLLEYYLRKHPRSVGSKIPLAIDVACGSGQLSGLLAEACGRVIGIDISQAMLEAAERHNAHPNVEYRQGDARRLVDVCGSEKADIIVIGMAIHFLASEQFYESVRSLLRPGGVFAVFGYLASGVQVSEKPELENFMLEYLEDQIEDPSFAQAVNSLKIHYKDVHVPFVGIERCFSQALFPSNRAMIRGLLQSNPVECLKDGEDGVEKAVAKVPSEGGFGMICDIFGILSHS